MPPEYAAAQVPPRLADRTDIETEYLAEFPGLGAGSRDHVLVQRRETSGRLILDEDVLVPDVAIYAAR